MTEKSINEVNRNYSRFGFPRIPLHLMKVIASVAQASQVRVSKSVSAHSSVR